MTDLDRLARCPSCDALAAISLKPHCDHGKCGWLLCKGCTAVISIRTGKHTHGRST